MKSSTISLYHLLHLVVRIKDEMPIVSLGLANFYAQLTNREARAFITKKLTLLEQ